MESRKSRSKVSNFQEIFYGDRTYKKEERREGRSKIRRTRSSQEAPISRDRGQISQVRRGLAEHNVKPKTIQDGWEATPNKRRWGWAGSNFEFSEKNPPAQRERPDTPDQDYDMSSMDATSSSTSEEDSSLAYLHERLKKTSSSSKLYSYNKLSSQNNQSVSRSCSVHRPSPSRAKSLGPTTHPSSVYPSRTQTFTSIYDSGYGIGRGTTVDLRHLTSSASTQGIFFTSTGHVHRSRRSGQDGCVSLSLQDVQMVANGSRNMKHSVGRSLLDLSNVTINDSEIDKVLKKEAIFFMNMNCVIVAIVTIVTITLIFVMFQDEALLIVYIARKAVEIAGDLRELGVHGQIASLIKDRLEEKLSDEGWQCVVGRKGAYGSCLSPAAQQYLHFHLGQVTVILFKAN